MDAAELQAQTIMLLFVFDLEYWTAVRLHLRIK